MLSQFAKYGVPVLVAAAVMGIATAAIIADATAAQRSYCLLYTSPSPRDS